MPFLYRSFCPPKGPIINGSFAEGNLQLKAPYAFWLPCMGWLRLIGSLKLYVSIAKETYKRDDILQKRPIILRSLLIVATL